MDPSTGPGAIAHEESHDSSAAASPTDTRHRPSRFDSYVASREDGLSESFQSFQSTDTVRRRPEGGYGSIHTQASGSQYPSESSAHDRSHSRSTQATRSPMMGPERPKASRPRKPPMPRRLSTNPSAPHRGEVFSADDDIYEVEADAAERHQGQRANIYGTRRRPQLPTTLSRVQSTHSENNEDEDDEDDGPRTPRADENVPEELERDPSVHPDEEDIGVESDGDVSDAESFTLKDRQQAINQTHPFGIRLWKPALYKKDRSVQKNAEGDIHSTPGGRVHSWLLFFNLLWTLLFGWWMAAFSALGAVVCFLFAATPSGREYGRVLWGLAAYLFYPFGKFVRLEQDEAYLHEDQGEGRSISEYEQWQNGDLEYGRLFFGPEGFERTRSIVGRSRRSIDSEPSETDSLLGRSRRGDRSQTPPQTKRRLFGRGQWNIGRVVFFLFFYLLLSPSLILVSLICWFFVFSIPMGKVTMLLFDQLRRHPLALSFEADMVLSRTADTPQSSILLCTYRAVGIKYWKYTIDGTNVFLINLMGVVFFVIFDWLVLDNVLHLDLFITSPAFLFITGLFSIVPLAYFIGQAVASISAQSSMGVGAAINAFFSTIVEVFLYCVALSQGKGHLVEGSIVGSIFAGILFLPGLSMCFGAIKRKTQRFNARSAGVTSTMLLFAVLGAFGPTLFYQIYGTHELNCLDCVSHSGIGGGLSPVGDGRDCKRCFFSQTPALNDRFYLEAVRPFCYFCATLLFLSYIVGLWFTLRTHAAVIWNSEIDEKKHEEAHAHARQSVPHSFAETTGTSVDVRDSHLYKRILGQSLKQVGLAAKGDDASRHDSTTGLGLAPGNGGVSIPHVVPPKSSSSETVRSTVHIPGFSEAENNALVREVAEMAATAATIAARERMPRRTSAQPGSLGANLPRTPALRTAAVPEAEDLAAASTVQVPHGGHDAPNWSRGKSAIILMGATVLYAIIAEILVDTVDVVLEGFAIDEKFLGITLFALVPNTTEFLNAISFAMNGNIALSMEIGSAYALQVCLLQIPALVFYSAFWATTEGVEDVSARTFALLFPQWDMVTVIICVFLLSYMYGEGKSNYFKGSILLLSYLVVVVGYYLSGFTEDGMSMNRFDVMGVDGQYSSYKTVGRRLNGAVLQG
ncbi:sodium/calcium exchanger protein [Colletotrichum graminicola]|uniref:Sodium/calcium exchanger protein n=1 Tax=Colletotrichum graminicola (strain M1.001 / M2 / FGSC 10212) TaxID=645133 RepID=E3QK10_COLGM|nr:sodium/calcium exchanger protein [Colletotrichum graminicola M1.001]EFQ31198.1 sodium/calcium exchanger protein [Colletotrichum graminicola M1.001]WDK10534.1 sodium/calcium exchanger protein [Colletotrichum graminicola]